MIAGLLNASSISTKGVKAVASQFRLIAEQSPIRAEAKLAEIVATFLANAGTTKIMKSTAPNDD